MHKATAATTALALPVGLVLAAAPARADVPAGDTTVLHAQIQPLNEHGAGGTSTVELRGTRVTVQVHATGLAPGLPHAQHLHIGGENTCPPGTDSDENGDGFVSTIEGMPSYGPEAVSLTTEGGTGAEHKLALDRMAVADEDGKLAYQRTFEVDEDVAERIGDGEAVLVQRGIDTGGDGSYDFNGAGRSDLDESVPAEATHPAACGALTAAPERGMDTGLGGTADTSGAGLVGLGAALVTAAGAVALAGRQLLRNRT
ncbi:hypothetical protein A6A08_05215 [Nocardiopsis sp. TSRI0078]|uniref:hypothetical protein n=1 Tax=unclassified Nocardiopsis TaxID=2649073 RepID=UPI00093CAFE3|nr:hypothetical protein [Nocardiopsis sp. TSRI0078]OKI19001.1 hypothetical protein A6A08_05215 [Nocardiopsis sp. TSRI0078]